MVPGERRAKVKESGPVCRRETSALKGYWGSTGPGRFSIDGFGYFPSQLSRTTVLYGLLGLTDIVIS